MLDALKPLLDSDLINEETRSEIQEAWDAKLNETRESVTAELREEFARRYEHDKSTMVEALDRMVTESLSEELQAVAEETKALAEDRAKFVTKMTESSATFDKFLVKQLSEELKDLHADRDAQAETIAKLEQFVVGQLAEEIQEFQADRQDVVETKVRLVKEAREQFKALKENFVKKSSAVLEEAVTTHLKSEISQLKEDIEVAKHNNFGRKIFEAFATEFSSSMLNENQEIKDLKSKMEQVEAELDEAKVAVAEKNQIVESKEKEIAMINESAARKDAMETLMKPLNKEKSAIMRDLLESVQTEKLKGAFDRYLPAVLDGKSMIKESKAEEKTVIKENIKEVTGDKQNKKPAAEAQDGGNIVELRALAGLK